MKKILALVLLVQITLFANPNPLQHSRWTTNADGTLINGATLTNIPQSAVSNFVGSYQPATANGTNWGLHSTNDYYGTNANLQAGSVVLTNFATLGTNAWIPYGGTPSKGTLKIYNGTNWVNFTPPAGTSLMTYNVSTATGGAWVSVADPANLGSGSSLSTAVLYRDGIWRVPSASTNGTNISIFLPSQFDTNVNAQVEIKSGASVTNLQGHGTTALDTVTSSELTSGTIVSIGITTDTLAVNDVANFSDEIDAAGVINATGGLVTTTANAASFVANGTNGAIFCLTNSAAPESLRKYRFELGTNGSLVLWHTDNTGNDWQIFSATGSADGSGETTMDIESLTSLQKFSPVFNTVDIPGDNIFNLAERKSFWYVDATAGDMTLLLQDPDTERLLVFVRLDQTTNLVTITNTAGVIKGRDAIMLPPGAAEWLRPSSTNWVSIADALGNGNPNDVFGVDSSGNRQAKSLTGTNGVVITQSNTNITISTLFSSLALSTNASTPANTNIIVKWGAVTLPGDTNQYRIPLYK